jgi:hypothetical protein
MSNAALSDGQFAEHLNRSDTGGASLNFKDRTEVSGKGFMTAFSGAEKTLPLPAKEEDITSFKEKNKPAVEGNAAAVHGAWKYPEGHYTQDLSVQVSTPKESQKMGENEKQQAAYALPGSRVSSRGHHLKEGGDVLFHTADLGKNDSDPRYRPGALDMAGGKGSFTRNQYANKDWKKVGGTLNGKPVNYESVLRTINENRTNRMRGE